MKSVLFGIFVLVIFSLTSCYVGVEGRHHRHAARIEIHADNSNSPKDSLVSPAMSTIDQNDSLKSPVLPAPVKK